MTQENPNQADLYLMLGEIRGDLKYLVQERQSTNRRLDEVEAAMHGKVRDHDKRLGALEAFKVKVGVLTGALGVLVPTGLTVLAHKLGLLS